VREQFGDRPRLWRRVGVGEPEASRADVTDRRSAEDPRDLRRGPSVVGDREHVGDAGGEAVDPAFF